MSIFNFLSLPKNPFYSLLLPNVWTLLHVWTLDPLHTCIEISRDNTGWFWLTLVLVCHGRIWQAGTTTHSLSFFLAQHYACAGFPTIVVRYLLLCQHLWLRGWGQSTNTVWRHIELVSRLVSQLGPLPNVPQLFWNHSGDWVFEILLGQMRFSQTQTPQVL